MSKVISVDQIDSSHSDNIEKYRVAGETALNTLNKVLEFAKDGATVKTLCTLGDRYALKMLETVYSKKKLEHGKGLAFPTCVSVNEMAGYYSPLDETLKLKDGDLIKVEVGVHVDGFPALVGTTTVVGDGTVKDARSKVVLAANEAEKAVLKLMKSGKKNFDVTKKLQEVADKYGCSLPIADFEFIHVPGVISYQVSQNILDGHNDDIDDDVHKILMPRRNEDYEFEMGEAEIEENEVYVLDIVMCSGTGRLRAGDAPTTVYKRNHEKHYSLRLRSSKMALNKFQSYFPESLREFNDTKVRFGLKECTTHGLVEPYPVLYEKAGEWVATKRVTVAVRKKKPIIFAKHDTDLTKYKLPEDKPAVVEETA